MIYPPLKFILMQKILMYNYLIMNVYTLSTFFLYVDEFNKIRRYPFKLCFKGYLLSYKITMLNYFIGRTILNSVAVSVLLTCIFPL